jgi:hypothetical protein
MRYTRSIKMDTSEKSTLFILELSNPSWTNTLLLWDGTIWKSTLLKMD